jgi:threonine/homoserine/homoserine lactone efflux protein
MSFIAPLVASPAFITFLGASLILALIPGPGVIYIVTRTLNQGRRAGLASVCGIACGNFANAAAASVGLAAIIAASSGAFVALKLGGAAYLVYLGVKALRTSAPLEAPVAAKVPAVKLLRDGFFVALLNPKTALFFAALLPQFIDPAAPALQQSLILGSVFVAIALCTDSIYVLTASALASTVRKRTAWRLYGRFVSAATYIGLGVYAALASPRTAK